MVAPELVERDGLLRRLGPLPVCALLLAPHSTGKTTAALAAASAAGIPAVDTLLVPQPYWTTPDGRRADPAEVASTVVLSRVEPELSVDMVRELSAWARTAPRSAAGKLAVVRLGHAAASGEWVASSRCQNALLKLLEEPPAGVRFVLTAASGVLPTIASRSVVTSSGLLSTEGVACVLDRVTDLDPEQCRQAAALGGGRVRPALARAADTQTTELARVRGVLAALARGDTETVTAAAPGWTEEATELFGVWARERCTERWCVFADASDAVLPRPAAYRVLQLLSEWKGTRPRLLLAALASGITS